jgi:hypothetical protein
VKTLRAKLALLCADPERPRAWSSTLAEEWMAADPETAGTLYIDGHVRVYHGALTKLPRRYVSRQRLCLRRTEAAEGTSGGGRAGERSIGSTPWMASPSSS